MCVDSLEGLQPEYPDDLGNPLALPGGFAWVFPMVDEDGKRRRALKVFKRPVPERFDRYPLITAALDGMLRTGASSVLQTEFHAEALRISATGDSDAMWFPAVVLEWSDAVRLDDYLDERLQHGQDVRELAFAWLDVIDEFRRAGVAHGDLQHGNILVQDDGSFVLIDYDGMYVPELGEDRMALERGVPGYQPPSRSTSDRCPLDAHLDEYSALTILVTLATATPELWEFHERDSLILQEDDLLEPENSAVLRQMGDGSDEAASLVECLIRATATDTTRTDELAKASELLGRPLAEIGTLSTRPTRKRRRRQRRAKDTEHLEWGPPDLIGAHAASEPAGRVDGSAAPQMDATPADQASDGVDEGSDASTNDSDQNTQVGAVVGPPTSDLLPDGESPVAPHLTHLEQVTLVALMRGRTTAEVAAASDVQERTVRERIARVRRKFSTTTTEDVLAMAHEFGLTAASFTTTARQREVLQLRLRGDAIDSIANELAVRSTTIERHVSRAVQRLGATDEREAIASALVLGDIARPTDTIAPARRTPVSKKATEPTPTPVRTRPPEIEPSSVLPSRSRVWLFWMIIGPIVMLAGVGQLSDPTPGRVFVAVFLFTIGGTMFEHGRTTRQH